MLCRETWSVASFYPRILLTDLLILRLTLPNVDLIYLAKLLLNTVNTIGTQTIESSCRLKGRLSINIGGVPEKK